ncbi:MAG: tRNA threonylcarbamoyladenosine dehydratase [Bacteroidetes bacterium ADurb.Bin217]|nr:MAG: tRNA threonylcarbamoyladenosine dehydratase [Bacteroidetes bacterium ADurb.Bin217]
MNTRFQRSELLLGSQCMQSIASQKVIVFGIGGVGSWCTESLIRSGIRHLTIVDSDIVCETNCNRQLHATSTTIGKPKVEVMRSRLLEINPQAHIVALHKTFTPYNSDDFELHTYDYIIDCIDSLACKIELIRHATRTNAVFFSSMGASLKINPLYIQVAEFWKVRGCPFGSIIRKRMRKGELPAKKFLCVYSEEVLENKGESILPETHLDTQPVFTAPEHDQWQSKKAVLNGTMVHVTAVFGFTLAGLVIQNEVKRFSNNK